MPQSAPFGTWASPIDAGKLASKGQSIESLVVDPILGTLYHVERRPTEGGRCAIVETSAKKDLTGGEWNARSRVHEYGGGAVSAYHGTVYFTNFKDCSVYAVQGSSEPKLVITGSEKDRYCSFNAYPPTPHFLITVSEKHHTSPATNCLALLDTQEQLAKIVVEGADFYSHPFFSPDGSKLAWVQWFLPDMPWDGAQVCVGSVKQIDGSLEISDIKVIAGEKGKVASADPIWLTSSRLFFVSEQDTGYLNPWIYDLDSGKARRILEEKLPADFALPLWQIEWTFNAALSPTRVFCAATKAGAAYFVVVDVKKKTYEEVPSDYVTAHGISTFGPNKVVFTGRKADFDSEVVQIDFSSSLPAFKVLKSSPEGPPYPSSYIPPLQAHELEGVHVNLRLPTNPDFTGVAGEKPPAIVNVHGGPTWYEDRGLSWEKAYYTSRGFAWLDVNHSGSAGYGREYRDRLQGGWGVTEVHECGSSIRSLDSLGLIDSKRCVIIGSSAGGYTAFNCLAFTPTAFACGVPSYGIGNLKALQLSVAAGHKFESGYNIGLIGCTVEEDEARWDSRSAGQHVDSIVAPLYGEEDPVVPVNQAMEMAESIKKRGGKVELVVYPGEGHGWRRAETIKDSMERQVKFFRDILVEE